MSKEQREAVIIFPHQLFDVHPCLDKGKRIYLVEHPHFFSRFAFHIHKIILHRASMKAYYAYLKRKKYSVVYIEHKKAISLWKVFKKDNVAAICYADLVDHDLEMLMRKQARLHKIDIQVSQTPAFVSPREWLDSQLGSKKKYFMFAFYKAQRIRMQVLVHAGKPVGGAWSFDDQNREPLPENIKIPVLRAPRKSVFVREAIAYAKKYFKKHPGDPEDFCYPVTFAQARTWLDQFLKKRLAYFGTYQDAIVVDESFLFHSVLSSSLNNGLLTPEYVLDKTLAYAKKHKVPINSLEGFIRQLIGWREFVAGVYRYAGKKQKKSNFFRHRKKISKKLWHGTTAIEPYDATVQRVYRYAYAHHIERLMVLGNFMLLCRIHPDQVYEWFMSLFIDAYDWVMIPNVYGMSQYADGGLMTTKPYLSGANYILKMSNYVKGEWADIWTALYWDFLHAHRKKISSIVRMRPMYSVLKKMSRKKLEFYRTKARSFLRSVAK